MRSCLSTAESPEYILLVAHSTPLTRLFSVHPMLVSNNILGGRVRAGLEMNLGAEIHRTERWSGRTCSIEYKDALGGRD